WMVGMVDQSAPLVSSNLGECIAGFILSQLAGLLCRLDGGDLGNGQRIGQIGLFKQYIVFVVLSVMTKKLIAQVGHDKPALIANNMQSAAVNARLVGQCYHCRGSTGEAGVSGEVACDGAGVVGNFSQLADQGTVDGLGHGSE